MMKKNIHLLFLLIFISVTIVTSCKKKHHEDPSPAPGGSTSGPTTPTVPPVITPTTTVGFGTLTFQDTTTSLGGGCVNTSYGFLMAATDSVNSLSVLFYPSKPTTSQTIDLATVFISPRLTITSGNDIWFATSGNLSITVIQGHIGAVFSNVTFTNNTTGQTAIGSGSIACL